MSPYLAFKSIAFTYQATLCILSIGLFIAALEDLKSWSIFKPEGLLSWKVAKLSFKWRAKDLRQRLFNFLLQDRVFKCSIYLRIFACFLLFIFSLLNIISPTLICSIFFLNLLMNFRSPYGLDGSYQMTLVILFALSIGSLFGVHSPLSTICLLFIAGELLASYFIAGFHKLISPMWRKSSALHGIFSTRSYGHGFFFQLISRIQLLATFLSWFVFLFEMLFFTVLFFHPMYTILFCIIGFLFHVFNAIFMGLNNFLFAFSAAYPALFYCVNYIHGI
ncbi:MAG TPA: hypothetical protein VGZ69_00270 [Candidatus Rhabdochlamydia sp.]|jgi:hypothetical protein|nr:hypothetical protein [Candidatus Rhabdochlamydia sp.]